MSNPPFDTRVPTDATAVVPPRYGAKELLADLKKYRANGAPTDLLDRFVREETAGRYNTAREFERDAKLSVKNVGRAGLMGALWGFLDEVVAAAKSGLVTSPGQPGNFDPAAYAGAREDILRPYETFREVNPATSMVAEMAGGMALPVGSGVNAARAGAGVLPAVGRGAVVGAGAGGLAGLGYAPDLSPESLASAGISSAAGAVLGGTMAGATDLASLIARGSGGRRLARAVVASGGEPGVRASGARMAAAGRGDVSVLADLSPQLREAADFAATQNPAVRARYMPAMEQRAAGQAERMLDDVSDVLGVTPNAGARRDVLDATRRVMENSPTSGYAALEARVGRVEDERLGAFLKRPIVRRAFERAKEEGLLAGDAPLEPTFRTLNSLRKTLVSQAQSNWTAPGGNRDLAAALSTAATDLGTILKERVPGFADLQARVGGVLRETGALDRAAEFVGRADVRELRRVWAALDPAEREQFRYGLASNLVDDLNATATNRNAARSYLFASKNVEERLRIAFGSDENFAKWMQRVRAEREMALTSDVFGGSATARRAAAASDPNVQGVLSPIGGARRAALAIGSAAHRQRTAGQMGASLFGGGDLERILREIRELAARQSGGVGSQVLAPAAAGLLTGRQ